MPSESYWKPALAVFALTGCLLWLFMADRLRLNIDEGIYLDGALRSFHGQTIYRDFLAHTGPGTFWLCETAFRLLGVSLSHARIPLILGIASMVAGVFYLTAALTTRNFAYGIVLVFLLFETRDPYLIAINHRWDSGALAFLAVVMGFAAIRRDSRPLSFLAGVCAAAAAWVTPTVGLIAVPIAGWMLISLKSRRLFFSLAAGGALVTLVCAAILAREGAFQPMIRHLLWTSSNYSGPNRVPYGYAGSGFTEIASDLNPITKAFFSIILASVFLPAILPVFVYLGWAIWLASHWKAQLQAERDILFLLACSLALFASTYPRWDTGHLLYVMPVFYVLAATFLYSTLPSKALCALWVPVSLLVAFLWWQPLAEAGQFSEIQTASGPVAVRPEDQDFVETIAQSVHPGESLLVFPNFPTVYFLTGGVNRSHFSFLQAGLMTDQDEQAALRDLESSPPEWVVYWDVPIERYLKTSPSADPARLRFNRIERYLQQHYIFGEIHDHWHGPYSILERKKPVNATQENF